MSQMPPSAAFDQPAAPGKGMAVAALICAIVGFCIPGVALVGVILGIVGLVQANANPQRTGGKGMSIAAIIVGCLSMVACVFIVMMGILLPALGKARESARQLVSASNMRQIGIGLITYAGDNKEWFPEAGADVPSRLSTYSLPIEIFHSPRADPGVADSYVYIPGYKVSAISNPHRIVLLYENPKYVSRGVLSVLFADGHVESIPVNQLQGVLDASPKPDTDQPKTRPGRNRP